MRSKCCNWIEQISTDADLTNSNSVKLGNLKTNIVPTATATAVAVVVIVCLY